VTGSFGQPQLCFQRLTIAGFGNRKGQSGKVHARKFIITDLTANFRKVFRFLLYFSTVITVLFILS